VGRTESGIWGEKEGSGDGSDLVTCVQAKILSLGRGDLFILRMLNEGHEFRRAASEESEGGGQEEEEEEEEEDNQGQISFANVYALSVCSFDVSVCMTDQTRSRICGQ